MNTDRSESGAGRAALLALATLAVLAASMRGGRPGVPVADDYLFLAHQVAHGFDWLGTHGSDWYWRPVSRQLYYGALGARMVDWPWLPLAVHVGLLLTTFAALWSFGRRTLGLAGAVVLASSLVLMEPMRTLVAWPSASQHLLTLAAVALALASAAAGRTPLALLALAFAIGSHENALAALPLVTWLLVRAPGHSRRGTLAAVAVLVAAWALLRALAFAHGAGVPPLPGVPPIGAFVQVTVHSLRAFASLEDLPAALAALVTAGYAVVAFAAWRARAGEAARPRIDWPLVAGALVLWAVAALPLTIFLPEWNSWRNTLPALGLAILLATLAAGGGMRLALAIVALRAVALLLAPVPGPVLGAAAPETETHISYARLTRMQRTLEAARAALTPADLRRPGLRVRHWNTPRLAEFGFEGPRALQVWAGRTDVEFLPFGESEGLLDTGAVVIAFDPEHEPFAVRLAEATQRRLFLSVEAATHDGPAAADSLLADVDRLQDPPVERLHTLVLLNRVRLNLGLGRLALADSLHREALGHAPTQPWLLDEIRLGLARADTARVRAAFAEALAELPDDEGLRHAAARFGVTAPAGPRDGASGRR